MPFFIYARELADAFVGIGRWVESVHDQRLDVAVEVLEADSLSLTNNVRGSGELRARRAQRQWLLRQQTRGVAYVFFGGQRSSRSTLLVRQYIIS
jgi:hypothetical protein